MEGSAGAEPAPGATVIIVAGGEHPAQVAGEVTASVAGALELRIEQGEQLESAHTLLFIHGDRGARHVARGTYAGAKDDRHRFRVSGWQHFDARDSQRYPVHIPVEVRSVLGTSRQDGVVLDVSLGGAAVAVPTRPGGKAIELSLSAGGFASRLPCEVVGVNEDAGEVVLHLQFAALEPAQRAFVRTLVRAVQAALGVERAA